MDIALGEWCQAQPYDSPGRYSRKLQSSAPRIYRTRSRFRVPALFRGGGSRRPRLDAIVPDRPAHHRRGPYGLGKYTRSGSGGDSTPTQARTFSAGRETATGWLSRCAIDPVTEALGDREEALALAAPVLRDVGGWSDCGFRCRHD